MTTARYKTASRVPIGPGDVRYWRRNTFDDAATPQAKVMIFERFDFARKDRPARASGRERFHPNFNNPEATTRFALVDGSVDSIRMARLYGRIGVGAPAADVDTFTPSGLWAPPDSFLGDPSSVAGLDLNHDALENGDGSAMGIPGGFNKYPAFFWATRNGIQGRDIPR